MKSCNHFSVEANLLRQEGQGAALIIFYMCVRGSWYLSKKGWRMLVGEEERIKRDRKYVEAVGRVMLLRKGLPDDPQSTLSVSLNRNMERGERLKKQARNVKNTWDER